MEYIRKMQKRGMILIVLGIFLLIYAVFSSAQNQIGCCANPYAAPGRICAEITAAECCGTDAECISSYFYSGACEDLPINKDYLCEPGFCLGQDDETLDNNQYCKEVDYVAECLNQTAWYSAGLGIPAECEEGCCICEKAGDKVKPAEIITTEFECELACADLIGYRAVFDSTTKDAVQCEALVVLVELANLSGYVKDFAGAIQGANVLIQGKTAASAADGSYRIEGLRAGTGIQAAVSKTGYLTNTTNINLVKGENRLNFTLQSTQTGTLEGTIRSTVAAEVPNVQVSVEEITDKEDITGNDGIYRIRNIPFGKYTLVAAHPNFLPFSREVIISEAFVTVNINITPKLLSSLTGIVASAVCRSPTECYNAIGNAVVTLTGSLSTFTATSESREGIGKGFYGIGNIPANPGNEYTLRASADGFEPYVHPLAITFAAGVPKEVKINLVPIVPGCGKTDCTPPLDFALKHVPGKKAVEISWRSPCNIVAGFDVIKKDEDDNLLETIPVSAFAAQTYYSIEDENVDWNTTYNYEIIAYYPESDCKQSNVTANTKGTMPLGEAVCEGRFDNTNNRWIGFCDGNYLRKKCNDQNRVMPDASGGPADCSEIEIEGKEYFCSGPDKFGNTHCKNRIGCDAANIPPFGICQDPLKCWGANVYAGESSTNFCFLDEHPIYNQFNICKSCTIVGSCFDYTSELACKLDNSTCLKANGSICSWSNTTTSDYAQGFCYPADYKGTDRCGLCNIAKYPTIGKECTQDICDLLGDCYSVKNAQTGLLATCRACQPGTTKCEDYKSQQECVGETGGIHFEDDCIVVDSGDRCGLGACRWGDHDNDAGTPEQCFKDGDLDGSQDCIIEACLEDTEPPLTTVTQNDNPHIVISIDDNIIDFSVEDNRLISDLKIKYCATTDPNACCSADITKELTVTPQVNLKQYLESYNITNRKNNTYYLKYWAVDSNFNREQTRTKTITADIKEPEITVYDYPPEFIGIAETATLDISINVNERADCTDSLSGPKPESKIDSETIDIGAAKTVTYRDLPEGSYTYSVTCVDKVGNEKTETKEIAVIRPFIQLVTPAPVTDMDAFVFRIKTKNSADCTLIGFDEQPKEFDEDAENILNIELAGTERLYITPKQYFLENEIIPNAVNLGKIECTDAVGNLIESPVKFTSDTIGPITEFTAIDFNGKEWNKDNLPSFFSKSIVVKLDCKDRPFDVFTGELGFKCKETKYCEAGLYNTCNASQGKVYSSQFSVAGSKTICYQSWDNGIIKNYPEDPVKCVDLIVAAPLAITLSEPKTETQIDGNEVVLNIPGFDVKIDTSKDVSGCAFSTSADFSYDTQILRDKFKFSSTPLPTVWVYPNYPSSYKAGNKNLTIADPDADMYIMCKLSATAEILPEPPKKYVFIYDPTPPNITDAYATTSRYYRPDDPENVEIADLEDVYFRVDTDDKTKCRYDDDESIYSRMHNTFDGFEENGVYTERHIATIGQSEIADDLTIYEYYVACENRATRPGILMGNISETNTISFVTNFEKAQLISSAKVEPILKVVGGKNIIDNGKIKPAQLGGVFFTAVTNTLTKPGIGCYFSNSPNFDFNNFDQPAGNGTKMATEDNRKHTSGIIPLTEGSYNYRVICQFEDDETKDAYINFVIDQSAPAMLNITVSETGGICSNTSFSPELEAGDNLSGISGYEYRILKVTTPITEWTATEDENPDITGLNLTIGDAYIIEVKAVDHVGMESASIKKEFTVLDPESIECVGDKTPPTITINETVVGARVEVKINCYDKYGCGAIYYGYANTAVNCKPFIEYLAPDTLNIPTYLCYNASDQKGNIATGTVYITINDSDSDGILNKDDICPNTPIMEIYGVDFDPSSPNYGCGPGEIDADKDLLPDFWEEQYNIETCLLDSNNSDSDADGVSDADEDCDDDGKTNYLEYTLGLNPNIPDLEDTDGDGVTDDIDTCPNTPFGETADEFGCGDSQKDSDGDGMDDKWEKQNNLDHLDPTDADEDNDKDGLTNKEEYNEKTDPNDKDTDGDDHSDKEELDKGFDPLDATSFPPAAPIFTIIIIIIIILLLLGGGGYLAYMYRAQIEKFVAEKIMQKPAAPARPAPARPAMPVKKPAGPTPEEIERKRIGEIRRKRAEIKGKRREKAFEVFGAEKPKEKPKAAEKIPAKPKIVLPPIKPKEKKLLKPLAEVIKVPEERKEFERLARLTEEHILKGRPLEPLLKITKVPKGKEDEFKKLTELIKKKVATPEAKRKKELTAAQKTKIRDVFFQLGALSPEKEAAFERLGKLAPKKKGKTFEELSKLSKKKKRR
jgi:hypothetical protein